MSENKTNGQIQIADEVVGVIATTAALEVEGVVAGGGKGFLARRVIPNARKSQRMRMKPFWIWILS